MTYLPNNSLECLGVDWGKARIGLALGNSSAGIASPYATVSTLAELIEVIKKEDIGLLVLGEPINEQGGGINPDFSQFLDELRLATSVPIELVDERFTSQEATKLDRKGPQDQIAAMLILQSYFDTL